MREWDEFLERARGAGILEVRELELATPDAAGIHIASRPSLAFHGNLQIAIREAKTLMETGRQLAFFAPATGEIERLADIFSEYGVPFRIDLAGERAPEYLQQHIQGSAGAVGLIRGDVPRGTVFPDAGLRLFGAENLFESSEMVAKPGKSPLGALAAD